jgi:hypothetical protein
MGRFKRVVSDVNESNLQWLLHVGDILWFPCSNQALEDRRDRLNSFRTAVVYTPGDNEWTDCHERIAGAFEPLERLQWLRKTFFSTPGRSLGGRPMTVQSQSADTSFAEFAENVRWRFGRFVFATIHIVGSDNGSESFAGRTAAHDREAGRRMEAALAWLEATFDSAHSSSAHGVVIAMHGDPNFDEVPAERGAYGPLLERMAQLTRGFPGEVLLIHGDSHEQRVDHPLIDATSGRPLANFTRLETFGSPDIGWVRVVVDSVRGHISHYELRLIPRWRF